MSLSPSGRIELSLTPLVHPATILCIELSLAPFPHLEPPCSVTSLPLVNNLPNSEVLTSTQSGFQKAAIHQDYNIVIIFQLVIKSKAVFNVYFTRYFYKNAHSNVRYISQARCKN